jgi:type IV secretory pathway VirB10-like protein
VKPLALLVAVALIVLALVAGALVYYLPRGDGGTQPARPPTPVAPTAPFRAIPPAAPAPPAAQPAPGEGAPAAPAPGEAAPTMAELEDIAARLEQAGDEKAREMLMHRFVALAARMDYRDQMRARDRLEAIDRKRNPERWPAIATGPPQVFIATNTDGGIAPLPAPGVAVPPAGPSTAP